MKHFNEYEQKLIGEILRIDAAGPDHINVIGNILPNHLYRFNNDDTAYYIEVSQTSRVIQIQNKYASNVAQIALAVSKDIFVALKLFDYLVQEGLIYTYTVDRTLVVVGPEVSTIGNHAIDAPYTSTRLDTGIKTLLFDYMDKVIVPTQSLVELQKNGFLSAEELRRRDEVAKFKETIRWTQRGFWVAAGAATIASIIGLMNYFKKPDTDVAFQENSTAIRKSLETIASELTQVNTALNKLAPSPSATTKSKSVP